MHTLPATAHPPTRQAEQALAHAEGVAELADLNVRRNGGPERCSVALIERLIRAQERVWICEHALNRNGRML